jgi:enamine deaminase RidA (YjgF/YER057c/UK114 family)
MRAVSEDDPHARLHELGLELPAPPGAVAAYVPANVVQISDALKLVAVSGQVALRDGRPLHEGRVPDQVSVADAVDNARACALNVLAQLENAVGLGNIEQLLQVSVFVRSADDFTAQSRVGDGASDLLVAVLGDKGRHARAAVGVNALPLGVPVEVAVLALARG